MIVVLNRYTTIIQRYGLRYIARRIWLGGIVFSVIHAAAFWYAKYLIGDWGERMAAVSRAFNNHGALWNGVVAVLGFPLSSIDASGLSYFGLMVLNSVLWGIGASFLIVPAFVKK